MSLRERMRAKAPATTTHSLRIEDDTVARAELTAAHADGGPERIREAREAVNACYEELQITALAPDDLEALIAEHPPADPQKNLWNPVTFIPALLAACIEGDATVEDWTEWTTTGPMTAGETNTLFDKVYGVNYRTTGPILGKDSTGTPS